MGIPVTVSANGSILNADGNIDLLELTPADDKPIKLARLILSNGSELGDAAEEQLRITVRRLGAAVTSGSGGAAPAIEAPDSQFTPALAAEAFNDSVATTTGANDILADFYWNVRMRDEFVWPEEKRQPTARGSEVLVIRCESTAADDLTCSITAELDEG